jgi:hypothetical protein
MLMTSTPRLGGSTQVAPTRREITGRRVRQARGVGFGIQVGGDYAALLGCMESRGISRCYIGFRDAPWSRDDTARFLDEVAP